MPNSAADKAALDERTRLFHEVYVPTFSCLALISVTVFIMIVASIEISSGGDDSADANVMFAFASVNAVIDITCITMFYFRKDDIVHNKFPSFSAEPVERSNTPMSLHSVNINMFSAFTHIGSDTLRTLAVFGAAIVSSSTGKNIIARLLCANFNNFNSVSLIYYHMYYVHVFQVQRAVFAMRGPPWWSV